MKLYCKACRKKTEHKYLGTSRYTEPLSSGGVSTEEEGIYECECTKCRNGPVQK